MKAADLKKKLELIDDHTEIFLRSTNDELKEIEEVTIQFSLKESEPDLFIIG